MSGGRAGAPDGPQCGADVPDEGEIYLEYTGIGAQMRAVAIDAATGIEVTVFGPLAVPRDELGRLAVRKLQRRMASSVEEKADDPPISRQPGISRLV